MPRSIPPPHRLEAVGQETGQRLTDVPVEAHNRPLLDDRCTVASASFQGRSPLTIDRTASEGIFCSPAPTRRDEPPGDLRIAADVSHVDGPPPSQLTALRLSIEKLSRGRMA